VSPGRTSEQDAASEATKAVIRRLVKTWNGDDLEAFLDCFHPEYASTQPLFPDRSFLGRDNVRERWTATFATMADFRANLLALAVDGNTAWTEWHWHGTRPDGSRRDERGIIIYRVRDGVIASGRLYMAPGPDDSSSSA
jgi:ketosteroid isomerase-like protein